MARASRALPNHPDACGWLMLAVLSAGVFALTLNWFDVATAFPLIGSEFHLGLGSLSYLISLFIVGYGLAHIAGGLLATAIGIKKSLVLGLLVQGIAGVTSGLSTNYFELELSRVLSGVGGSVFATVGFAAVVTWFHGKDVTLALGLYGGAAFSAGAATALYVWVYIQRATSWHTSLVLAGIIELAVMVATIALYRAPIRPSMPRRITLNAAALRDLLAHRDLWIYGIAILGAYGAYLTTSQLFSEYAITDRHLNPAMGGLLSALIPLAGVPGSILGGYWADRSKTLRLFVAGPLIVVAALLALTPAVPTDALWITGVGIGFFLIFGFSAWSAVPARVCDIDYDQIGTATGLMLTLAAIGGFFIPIIFGHIVPRTSFDTGWLFLACAAFTFALVGLAGRNPTGSARPESAGSLVDSTIS